MAEFSSFRGGSTIFFADVLKNIGTGGKVLTVDIVDKWDSKTNRSDIEKLTASSTSNECEEKLKTFRSQNPGKIMVILDSAHTGEHVYNELKMITPLLQKGDYVIIEDSAFNDGMFESIEQFMTENSKQYTHDIKKERKFGITLAEYGYWIKS